MTYKQIYRRKNLNGEREKKRERRERERRSEWFVARVTIYDTNDHRKGPKNEEEERERE